MSGNTEELNVALSGRYRIERELGAGGMATVYLAHDVRHDRRVALKVLRPELSAILGAQRFLTEIKTTANLQHPHILSLFDSGEADGTVFYVMPYVEGETLRDRIKREHQLPVEEAVRIAREVLDALEYAHKQGIVHRDIKPENILLHGGHAMVADFGIALAASKTDGNSRMTETGMSLGTPHYMSPEQAMGEREITPKADIYALGCVLYEMLTAEPPFTGASAQAIFARVLTDEPRSITMQRRTVPPNVSAAVNMALQKLPADRFATAAQFAEALGAAEFTSPATRARPAVSRALLEASLAQRALRVAPWVLAAAGIATSTWFATRETDAPPAPVARFAIRFTPDVATGNPIQVIAVSPDGSRIVFVGLAGGTTQLYTRTLDNVAPSPVPGTQGAGSPFFSPDGRHVAFVAGSRLLKVALAGGPSLPIADVSQEFRGGTWNEQDTIVYADDRGLMVVPSAGGKPALLLAADSSSTLRWPEFLPGGKTLLVGIHNGAFDRPAAVTIANKAVTRFDIVGGNPHYVRQGFMTLAMLDEGTGGLSMGTLVAVPFDAERLRVLGQAIPVTDSVQVGLVSRAAKLGVSRDGALAFAAGIVGRASLVAVNRNGASREVSSELRFFANPRLSPDGRRIATGVFAGGGSDIWIQDVASRTLTRLTVDRDAQRPVWTHDGRRVVFDRAASGGRDLAWIPADGSAPAESLLSVPGDQVAAASTPDGRTLAIRQLVGGRRSVASVSMDSARVLRVLTTSDFDAHSPTLSPDGRWVAYVSLVSARSEVYVRPFPGSGGTWQVSTDGGTEPRWSPTGREIFFRIGDRMMSAAVRTEGTFSRGEVRELFRSTAASVPNGTNYDVTRDGQTFIMVQPKNVDDQNVVVLLNWFDNARRPRK